MFPTRSSLTSSGFTPDRSTAALPSSTALFGPMQMSKRSLLLSTGRGSSACWNESQPIRPGGGKPSGVTIISAMTTYTQPGRLSRPKRRRLSSKCAYQQKSDGTRRRAPWAFLPQTTISPKATLTFLACYKSRPPVFERSGAKFKSIVSSRSALSQSLGGSAGPQIDHKSGWSTDWYVRRSAARSRSCRPNSCIG